MNKLKIFITLIGKNKYSITLIAALAKHQFTINLAKDTSPSAVRFVS